MSSSSGSLTNKYLKSRVLESYIKEIIVKDEDNNDVKRKHLFFSVLLQATSDVKSFAFDVKPGDVSVIPHVLFSLIKELGFADGLTAEQLADIKSAVNGEGASLYHTIPLSSEAVDGSAYLDALDLNHLVVPYDVSSPERAFRFVLDITEYDGINKPDIGSIWKDSPLIVYLNALGVLPHERAIIDFNIEFTDCAAEIKKIYDFITELRADEGNFGITEGELDFLKSIVDGTRGASADPLACVPRGFDLPDIPQLHTLPDYSLMFEISNLDKLLCYLKGQVIKYKSDITLVSGGKPCYGYTKCLIKSFMGLTKLHNITHARLLAISNSAVLLAVQYNRIKAEYEAAVEAAKGIRQSITLWINKNLDSTFDEIALGAIACSNNVGTRDDSIAFKHTSKYNKYYISNGARSDVFNREHDSE